MSRHGDITLEFGGEERVFRLAIGQWRKIQETCDAGPAELLARLGPAFVATRQGLKFDQILALNLLGTWRVEDVRQPILQGLLGANMPGPEALKLVREWVDERPLLECVGVAYQIVLAAVIGPEDEDASGERVAAATTSHRSTAASSDLEMMDSTPSAGPSTSALG